MSDIIIFDTCGPYGKSLRPKDIHDSDPRLSGKTAANMIQTVEDILSSSIQEADDEIDHIDWIYQVIPHQKHGLESYSIDMVANMYRNAQKEQSISALRIHRHAPREIVAYMESEKWRLIECKSHEINYPANLFIFQKY